MSNPGILNLKFKVQKRIMKSNTRHVVLNGFNNLLHSL